MLKIAIKLYKINTLNLDQFFYKKTRSIVKSEEICALKLLIAIDLNIYRLFSKRLLIAIAIAHNRFEIVKLLIQEYSVTLTIYSIYIAIQKQKSWRYLLKLDTNLNKKKLKQTLFIYIVEKRSSYLIEKLINTTDIDINKRDNKFESLLERTI